MKIYSIIITTVAILALAGGIYSFTQYNQISSEIKNYQNTQAETERKLADLQTQLSSIKKTNNVLITALESFMIPGDLKALAIGSQETIAVEQKITSVADSKDRMMMEENWGNFKKTRLLNSFFAFLRDATNNIERTLAPKQ